MQRALTGIQPSGNLHWGNYLGSIKPALQLQDRFAAFYFIADYHALTTTKDAAKLRTSSREIAATFLALGLDPERTVLWRQSAVPEVLELAWILSCYTPIGQLERGHAMKAAAEGNIEANAGTLYYPVLMSADILLFDANVVPVGEDQKQHVEIARDIATKLNFWLGEDTLVVPEVSIRKEVGKVPGLDGRKMSKSYGNGISLWDPPKKLRKTIMKIVTDSKGVNEPKDPGRCNVFNLYKLFATPEQTEEMRRLYAEPPKPNGFGYGHAKQALFEVVDAELAGPRERYHALLDDPNTLDDILDTGARRAREAASVTIARVRERVGLT